MRVFIGIKVPVNEKIRRVLEELSKFKGLKIVEPENLHLNLKFLGEVEEKNIEDIKKVLEELKGFESFEVSLKGVGAFPNQDFIRVVWIGAKSDKLIKLAKLIDSELQSLGFTPEKDYVGHLTLARVKRKIPEVKALLSDEDFGTLKVEKVELIKSELKRSGPVYSIIYTVGL